jgi:hypothetical protein
MNKNALFYFRVDNDAEIEVERYINRYKGKNKNDVEFKKFIISEEATLLKIHYPNNLRSVEIIDPFANGKRILKENECSYGLISIAAHDYNKDKFAILIAGMDLCATNAIVKYMKTLNYCKHPYGGVLKINKPTIDDGRWFDQAHRINEIDIEWITPDYSFDSVIKLNRSDLNNTIQMLHNKKIDMEKIMDIWR